MRHAKPIHDAPRKSKFKEKGNAFRDIKKPPENPRYESMLFPDSKSVWTNGAGLLKMNTPLVE